MFSITRNMYGSAKDVEQVYYVCIFQQVSMCFTFLLIQLL
jgi:hypothetical protein